MELQQHTRIQKMNFILKFLIALCLTPIALYGLLVLVFAYFVIMGDPCKAHAPDAETTKAPSYCN
jgi:hypothetical protein